MGWAFPNKPPIFILYLHLPPKASWDSGQSHLPLVMPHPHAYTLETTKKKKYRNKFPEKEKKLRFREAERTRELAGGEIKCRDRNGTRDPERAEG